MEEEKAAAYYDELSRKGGGAAKFKQGLGFSSSSSSDPKRNSSSSLSSSFVRASSPKTLEEETQKKNHSHVVDAIHSKLNRRSSHSQSHGHRDRERDRHRDGDRDRERRRRRSRSRSRERDRHRDRKESSRKIDGGVDYSKLIEGYSRMEPAERVKAKMKLQLSQTAAKDTNMGMNTGWERFDFNKDAPLDDEDDQTEATADDISLVKGIGKSFRFSAVEAKREEDIKAAHDQAMFGGASAALPVLPLEPIRTAEEDKDSDAKVDSDENQVTTGSLISDKVISMQQGSWRDRARRFQKES